LARQLGAAATRTGNNIRGLHIFTFNELAGTERWRRDMLAQMADAGDRE
jgi:methylenetetrahydrofolate reductase (NADPH)